MPIDEIVNPLGEPAEEPLSAKRPDAAQILRVFTDAYDAMKPRNVRVETTRDIRRGTLMVGVNKLWTMKFREAAPFVQSFLPERRTLERSVKASVGAVVPQISRAATGDTQGDDENAEWAEFYLNELRKRRFPARQCFGKGTEDGEYAFIVVPDAATMDGQPLYADTVTAARYKALKPAERKQYTPYGVVRNGVEPRRYVKLAGAWSDGTPKEGRNPEYDRDSSGRRRDDKYYTKQPKDGEKRPTFKRDEEKSGQAFDEAQRRYRAAHLPVTSLVMPALDVAPLLVRSKDGEHWALKAMVTRQLLGVEEAISAGYRWAGMGDRLLLPMGYEQDRMCGQRGMFYLYQLYTEEYDDDGRCHPLILSTVLGINGQTKQTDASNSNVDVLDLYDEWGIDVPLWDYCGGMSLSDDDPAFAYEPWMFPFINRILKIEGVETLSDMAMWENGNTGYVQDMNPSFSDDVLLDSSNNLRTTKIPDPGEVVAATGPVHPFAEQRVNPDFRYREESLRGSLREQTIAESGQPGESGHQDVIQHTLSIVAKDDIRAGVLRACKLFARGAARILDALSERGINWPIETSDDRPIGSKTVSKGSLIEWSRDWLGGSYEFEVEYPSEANPVEVSLAMEAWQKRAGSWEDLQKARGKSDAQSERLKVAEDEFWESDYGKALRQLAVAEFRRDQKAQKLAKLQVDKALAAIGLPGMEDGVPMGLLGGEGQPQPEMQGGPSSAAGTSSQQLVGSIVGSNSGAGPAANDARAIGQIPGAQGVGGVNGAVPGAA